MITFTPLTPVHFSLLLKWLELAHVKAWWDQDVHWTPDLIREKYVPYTAGYKRLILSDRVITKPMHAFIILCEGLPIGYIQYYNVHDFPREQEYDTADLPESCAAIDWYIGELERVGKGIGPKALSLFLDKEVFPHFKTVFVDPDTSNGHAIRAYEKAEFKVIKQVQDGTITWMLGENLKNHHSTKNTIMISLPQDSSALNEQILPATSEETAFLNEKIDEFNTAQLSFHGPLEVALQYTIKEGDIPIAGINACIYLGEILYVHVLFVEMMHRRKGLGSRLLKHVEAEAKAKGAKLAHLDTFDFQAKDFYLKHDYDIFGILEDCPKGHKRYYLRKNL